MFGDLAVDYLKYDWCSAGPHSGDLPVDDLVAPFARMRSALDRVARDIVYHICEYGWGEVWTWAADRAGANAWRTTGDIEDTWTSIDRIGFEQADLEAYAGPGRWNDPDLLVLGALGGAWQQPIRASRLTPDEQRSHFGLWVLLSAPLLLSCNLDAVDEGLLAMIRNQDVLAVHWDRLGRQAGRVATRGSVEIWRKVLADGSSAIGVFNRGDSQEAAGFEWAELGLAGPVSVRDLWQQRDLAERLGWQGTIAAHASTMLLVSPGLR
jgi:alpha-galactosidase